MNRTSLCLLLHAPDEKSAKERYVVQFNFQFRLHVHRRFNHSINAIQKSYSEPVLNFQTDN